MLGWHLPIALRFFSDLRTNLVLGLQKRARRSPIIPNPATTPSGGMHDPRSGCGVPSPFKNSMGYGSDYGYQYNVPMTGSGSSQEDRKSFSLGAFIAETVTGSITGGIFSAAFYGGGKALEGLKRSVKEGGDSVYIPRDFDGNPVPLRKQIVNGQDIPLPDPAAEGRPHTALSRKASSKTGEVYRQ